MFVMQGFEGTCFLQPAGTLMHLASPTTSLRNHSFKHFVYFVKEFDLIEESEQCSQQHTLP